MDTSTARTGRRNQAAYLRVLVPREPSARSSHLINTSAWHRPTHSGTRVPSGAFYGPPFNSDPTTSALKVYRAERIQTDIAV